MDVPLNPTGVEQATRTAAALHSIIFDAVVTSDLCRCSDTAHMIASTRPVPLTIIKDAQWRERGLGDFQGQSKQAFLRAGGNKHGPDWSPPGGGENVMTFHARVQRALLALPEAHPQARRICVVTHGGALDIVNTTVSDGDGDDGPVQNKNASISIVIWSRETCSFTIESWGSVDHLSGAAALDNVDTFSH
jgi:broad specificity phosphatase PhoE